jgi:hypothetical protein
VHQATALPQAPTRPAAPQAPSPYVVTLPPSGVPTNRAELAALKNKRSEISDQLVSATSRRNTLAERLIGADPGARPGLEARLKVLDDRIVKLEQELDVTGDQLANTPGELVSSTQMPMEFANRASKEMVPIVAILSVFVLGPFAIAMSRLIWKRGSQAMAPRVQTDHATQQRLEQLQQSVDTIAVEIERISEAQRFVTKVMNERDRPALPVGAAPAQPIAVKQGAGSERA